MPLAPPRWPRAKVHLLSRMVVVLLNLGALGSLLWLPSSGLDWTADILLRTYLMFLAGVMAHEGSHGHLGATRMSNDWWGRIALIPTWVPYLNFRKTHRMHHAQTNIPGQDPDLYIKPNHPWEIPLRALTMPHYWLVWLNRRGWLSRSDKVELGLHYVAMILIYSAIASQVGVPRVVAGLVPALALDSLLLWYLFALKTHEGFSTGDPKTRSHDYYGRFLFWFSLGLSMHRLHHQKPGLAWIEALPYVRTAPGPWWTRVPFRRDIHDTP